MGQTTATYWSDENGNWHGYLNNYPDYTINAESFEGLSDALIEIYRDISTIEIEESRNQLKLSV